MFSEAEKIGIDVRKDDTGSGLSFNFFQTEPEDLPAAPIEIAAAVDVASEVTADVAEEVRPVEITAKHVSLPSLSFIFSGAFSFHRTM